MNWPASLERLLALAVEEAKQAKAHAVDPIHLFIAAFKVDDTIIAEAVAARGIDPAGLRRRARAIAQEISEKRDDVPKKVSDAVLKCLAEANRVATEAGSPVDPGWVLVALLSHPDAVLLQIYQHEKLQVKELIDRLRSRTVVGGGAEPESTSPIHLHAKHPATPTLDAIGKDYTTLARGGKFGPVIGRKEEIKEVVRILLRKEKCNAVLLGDAGVGKTSIVEGLAQRAVAKDAPPEIRDMRIVELLVMGLIGGTKWRGELEERLQKVLAEAASDPNLVVFIDEIHMIVGAGETDGAVDVAHMLKPALARGTIRCIGATTPPEYRKYIEKDPALDRRFQPVRVEEPTPAQTLEILKGIRPAYEEHHKVLISDEALDAAVELTVRHLPDRRLPDKARDVIDQAAVNKRILTLSPHPAPVVRPRLERDDIAGVVAGWTGIPVNRITADQQARLIEMDDVLKKRVIGQDHAVAAVSQVVRTALAGLSRPGRPYGVFLFLGPTGVGKTELARALAEFLFDDEKRLLRFDMSEYMEEHSVSKLIGAPPGYVGHDEGGRLTDAVRRTPYSVVLFDEIEKAHPRVADLFLQIFDDGRLTDSKGRHADFRNTIIILTSNLGNRAQPADAMRGPVGFRIEDRTEEARPAQKEPAEDPVPEDLRKELLSHFRPELVNRISRIVPFRPLGKEQLRLIIEKMLREVRQRVTARKIELRVSAGGYKALMELGYRPDCGAREMERVIDRQIVQPLADGLLKGLYAPGSVVNVVTGEGGVVLSQGEGAAGSAG